MSRDLADIARTLAELRARLAATRAALVVLRARVEAQSGGRCGCRQSDWPDRLVSQG